MKEICDWAFDENDLEELVLNEGLIYIGRETFTGNKLKNIFIPSSVRLIESGAFWGNDLEKIVLNEGLETIEDGVFEKKSIKRSCYT